VWFIICTMVDINNTEDFLFKNKVQNHGLNRGEGVSSVINDRKGACKVVSDVACNANQIWVSERWKEAFPHIIIGRARNGGTKGI